MQPTKQAETTAEPDSPSGPRRDPRLAVLLLAVLVLIVNDWVLKTIYGNWVTGKLSDFAGLFAFALFCGLLFPRRRRGIALATAAAFVFWKSPASGPLIAALNLALPVELGRVVDWTDCVALVVLPLAVMVAGRGAPWSLRRARGIGLAAVSVLAFTATNIVGPGVTTAVSAILSYDEPYPMEASRERLVEVIAGLGHSVVITDEGTEGRFQLPLEDCSSCLDARTDIEWDDTLPSILRLRYMTHQCGADAGDSLSFLAMFEQDVVAPLRTAIGQETLPPASICRPHARQWRTRTGQEP